jgi:hypothetical protein
MEYRPVGTIIEFKYGNKICSQRQEDDSIIVQFDSSESPTQTIKYKLKTYWLGTSFVNDSQLCYEYWQNKPTWIN